MAIKISGTTVIDDSRNIQNVGVITATTINATTFVGSGSGLTGAGSTVFINNATNQEFFPLFTETTSGTITASGISTTKLKFNPSTGTVTATAFIGSGAGLTGAGSTVVDDVSTNGTFYPVLTQTTTGTITASKVSTTKLTFNPSTGTLAATTFSGALTGTASNVTTNANLTGHVTSVGNAAVLGSFTSLQLLTALSDETGSGANVFATSPTLVSPLLGTPTSGNLANCTFPTLNQNTSGTSASAAVLTTARNINDTSFNGSAAIVVNPSTGAYSNGHGARTIQSGGTASGGSSGDIFYIY